MIAQQLEPVCGVERRLRDIPQLSSQHCPEGISCAGRFYKDCSNYTSMHIETSKISETDQLHYQNHIIIEGGDSSYRRNFRHNPYPSVMRYGSMHEPPGIAIWPDPPDLSKITIITHTGANPLTLLLGDIASLFLDNNKFHNEKNRPFFNPSRGRSDRQGGRWGD